MPDLVWEDGNPVYPQLALGAPLLEMEEQGKNN